MINHGIWGAYLMFGNMYMYIDNIYIERERDVSFYILYISYHIISYHIIYIYTHNIT